MVNKSLNEMYAGLLYRAKYVLSDKVTSRLSGKRIPCATIDKKSALNRSLEKTRFVVLDTETTGFHVYSRDEIVSISMIEITALQPTGKTLDLLINPQRRIPAESTAIHGISDQQVANAPIISDVLPQLIDFMADSVLVGHHLAFDMRFLNKALLKSGFCHLNNLLLDTMLLYLGYSSRLGHYSLDEVAEACHVSIHDRHTSMGDTRATAEIFRFLAQKLCSGDQSLGALINRQGQPHAF